MPFIGSRDTEEQEQAKKRNGMVGEQCVPARPAVARRLQRCAPDVWRNCLLREPH